MTSDCRLTSFITVLATILGRFFKRFKSLRHFHVVRDSREKVVVFIYTKQQASLAICQHVAYNKVVSSKLALTCG